MKAKKQGVTIKLAAEILGKAPQFVRLGMQRGELPIGSAIKTSSIYTYYISPKLLSEFTGVSIQEIVSQVGNQQLNQLRK